MPPRSRKTFRLLAGRHSQPGSWYFITWCTQSRRPYFHDLTALANAAHIIRSIDAGDGIVLAATVMPDHIHLLLELGHRLTASQVVAKTKSAICRKDPTTAWQANFFDHRLRDTASAEDYALYLFMNPYCAQLCTLDKPWPGWIPGTKPRWAFEAKLRPGGLPQPEWVPQADRFSTTLPAGAD